MQHPARLMLRCLQRSKNDVKLWVAVTDKDWFQFLAEQRPEEVNFWQPSGSREFRVLQPGEPFLFKLHSPYNFIVGGGFFVRYSALPVSLAWDAFEQNNGTRSIAELHLRLRRYRREEAAVDTVIGCNVLAEPFFLPRSEWVPVPSSWAPNIVQGKTYDTQTSEGRALWNSVVSAMPKAMRVEDTAVNEKTIEAERFGAAYLTRGRLGQGAFRVLVTDAYSRRCAVTGEKTLPVLEAAHIKPYAADGPHRLSNGILLRSDLHKLFDLGYVTVTPDLHFEVSPKLKLEWENGREYYAHHGKSLRHQPVDEWGRPSQEFLTWHNENRFRA
jgi:putative restriction endonuclease